MLRSLTFFWVNGCSPRFPLFFSVFPKVTLGQRSRRRLMYLLGNGGQAASPGEAFHYGSVPMNLCLLASAKCAGAIVGPPTLWAFQVSWWLEGTQNIGSFHLKLPFGLKIINVCHLPVFLSLGCFRERFSGWRISSTFSRCRNKK